MTYYLTVNRQRDPPYPHLRPSFKTNFIVISDNKRQKKIEKEKKSFIIWGTEFFFLEATILYNAPIIGQIVSLPWVILLLIRLIPIKCLRSSSTTLSEQT